MPVWNWASLHINFLRISHTLWGLIMMFTKRTEGSLGGRCVFDSLWYEEGIPWAALHCWLIVTTEIYLRKTGTLQYFSRSSKEYQLCKCIYVIWKLAKLVNSLRNIDGQGELQNQHILIGFHFVENCWHSSSD